jgi:hypothetical protein
MGLMVCLISLSFATLGLAGVPNHELSTATTAAATLASVFTNVDGQGNTIAHARTSTGPGNSTQIDATITAVIVDSIVPYDPIFQYPFEDMWLETSMGGLLLCNGGSVADASTDVNGETTFSGALFAGGGSSYDLLTNEQTIVIVDGDPITSAGSALDIIFNTADLNGDLIVGVQDTTLFKPAYISGTGSPPVYDYAIDYYFDKQITLSDLVLFAGVANSTCP